MPGKIEININQVVKVKLSKEARERKEKEIVKYNERFNANRELKIDGEGYYEDSLWRMLNCGSDTPIEGNKIIIEF